SSFCIVFVSSAYRSWYLASPRLTCPPLGQDLRLTATSLPLSSPCWPWRGSRAGWGRPWSGYSTYGAPRTFFMPSIRPTALRSSVVCWVPATSLSLSSCHCSSSCTGCCSASCYRGQEQGRGQPAPSLKSRPRHVEGARIGDRHQRL